jgi:hypothetical protein
MTNKKINMPVKKPRKLNLSEKVERQMGINKTDTLQTKIKKAGNFVLFGETKKFVSDKKPASSLGLKRGGRGKKSKT